VSEPRTPISTAEALAALAAMDPDRPAVTHGDRTVIRSELEARTNQLARAYIELGVTPDSSVTIGLPNGIEFVEATIAVWKARATPQPVSARLPTIERGAIIELADPSLVVESTRSGHMAGRRSQRDSNPVRRSRMPLFNRSSSRP
jgi:bile acid-coenzyme A ligase